MTALCQYYDEVMYDDLVQHKSEILSLVQELFEKVKSRVPITPKEYVIDFLVDFERKVVRIVEINPFGSPDGMGTGTVMFDLKKAHDIDVLFGKAPFEFRVETSPLSNAAYQKMLSPEYRQIVQKFE